MKIKRPAKVLRDSIYTKELTTRFLDVNAGGHISNHVYADYMTETISSYLATKNHSLGNVYGASVAFRNIAIKYKKPLFYPSQIKISLSIVQVSKMQIEYYLEVFDAANDCCAVGLVDTVFIDLSTHKSKEVPKGFSDSL